GQAPSASSPSCVAIAYSANRNRSAREHPLVSADIGEYTMESGPELRHGRLPCVRRGRTVEVAQTRKGTRRLERAGPFQRLISHAYAFVQPVPALEPRRGQRDDVQRRQQR